MLWAQSLALKLIELCALVTGSEGIARHKLPDKLRMPKKKAVRLLDLFKERYRIRESDQHEGRITMKASYFVIPHFDSWQWQTCTAGCGWQHGRGGKLLLFL